MDAKYQVFVSSTFEDLQDERRAVIEQILNMGHIPVGMEIFQASNDKQWEYVRKRIAASDYFIVIIAERYGSVDETGISFTRKEYEYALECGVPVAAFLLSRVARNKWPAGRVERGKEAEIEDFRRLASEKLCKFWESVEQLKSATGNGLAELSKDSPRPGWIRADSILFKNLNPTDPESFVASSNLRATVDRDLLTAGYYRSDQVLEFGVEQSATSMRISLLFHSKIVPIHEGVKVYKPSVQPPDGVRLLKSTYFIGDNEITSWKTVSSPMRDRLCVEYEMPDGSLDTVRDRHYWPSPVLDYSIRFRKSELFKFTVGRIVGQTDPDPIDFSESGDCLVSIGVEGGLTAQGLEWKLSRS